jgi:hypothetical protein
LIDGAGNEGLSAEKPVRLITNRTDRDIDLGAIESLVADCNVPEDVRIPTCMEIARILGGGIEHFATAFEAGRSTDKYLDNSSIYGNGAMQLIGADSRMALESFGEYSDKLATDVRLSVALTILRAHRSLIDRILPRVPVEDPVVTIKIPSPEVYNLEASQDKSAKVRYSNTIRQPLISLYRNPDPVNTTPQQIIPQEVNDTDGVMFSSTAIGVNKQANMFDLAYDANRIGYSHTDWTDLVADGGSVDYIIVAATKNIPASGGTAASSVTELFKVGTRYLKTARYVMQMNVNDSGERGAKVTAVNILNSTSLEADGVTTTALFANYSNGVAITLNIDFAASLNIKTSYVNGFGNVTADLVSTVTGTTIPAALTEDFGLYTFSTVGYMPYLFFSEENLRKTNAAVRLNYKEEQFLIPVGRNFITEFSLRDKNATTEDIVSTTNNVIALGNSARALSIITNTLRAVNDRLQYEAINPEIDWYNSVAQDYAAGTLVNPHVYIGALDLSKATVFKESERLGDLHMYLATRLTGLLADGHNKSLYTENLDSGEKVVYKLITSQTIAELFLGISNYYNTLDDKAEVGKEADRSFNLPNGIRIDVIKTQFEQFEGLMLLIPVREADPEHITSFGKNLDRGTFTGQFTMTNNNAVTNRVVANSREIVFPTNPVGYIINVIGVEQELQILVDGITS